MLYAVIAMAGTFIAASFAIDYGRVQLAKTELRRAADSGARAAAQFLGNTAAAQSMAVSYAGQNKCDGSAVVIDPAADVEFGSWDITTRTFTLLTGSARSKATAVRVTCTRELPMAMASVAGFAKIRVKAAATAALIPPGFGLVGLNYIKLNGNSTASYWSSTGAVGGSSGHIASNGNISSTNNSIIQGSVWTPAGATVTGVTADHRRTLSQPLSYPNGSSAPYSRSYNDNSKAWGTGNVNGSGDLTVGGNKYIHLPAGNYVFRDVVISAQGDLYIDGQVTIYFYGTFSMGGQAATVSNLPKNLKIVGIPNPSTGAAPGSVTIGSQAALYADVYAPQSAITLSGSGAIYGAVVGKSIDMTGTSDIYYDLSNSGGSGVVQMVK